MQVRDEELDELDKHMMDTCYLPVSGGSESTEGKVNILLQTYISKQLVDNFSLVSDMSYVAQVCVMWLRYALCGSVMRYVAQLCAM